MATTSHRATGTASRVVVAVGVGMASEDAGSSRGQRIMRAMTEAVQACYDEGITGETPEGVAVITGRMDAARERARAEMDHERVRAENQERVRAEMDHEQREE